MKYFFKELPDTPIYIAGHPLRFDIMQTSDPALINEFENCIRRHQGGIVEITAERYAEELKKKEQETLSGNNLRPQQRQVLSALHLGNPGAAAASRFAKPQMSDWQRGNGNPANTPVAHPMPDPIDVPTAASFALPPVAKMKDLKEMAERAKPQ